MCRLACMKTMRLTGTFMAPLLGLALVLLALSHHVAGKCNLPSNSILLAHSVFAVRRKVCSCHTHKISCVVCLVRRPLRHVAGSYRVQRVHVLKARLLTKSPRLYQQYLSTGKAARGANLLERNQQLMLTNFHSGFIT